MTPYRVAHVTSTADETSALLSESDASAGVSDGAVVPASLKVTVSKNADLAGSAATPAPSIADAEGVPGAWNPTLFGTVSPSPQTGLPCPICPLMPNWNGRAL